MLKRPRDVFDTPSSSSPPMPPPKRQSVLASGLDAPTFLPALPRRSPWASSVPHDSPSNPFGLNRSLRALALPRPTGFAKHAVLRMQVVSQIEGRARSRRLVSDAPYRIVQVPLSYSFRLLHELILFLFASDASLRVRRPRRVFSPSLYPHQPLPPPRKRKSALQILGESPRKEEGHLFEVFNDVSVYANTYRPGVIKPGSGKLYARLSSTRERKLFSKKHEDEDDDDDVFGNPLPKPSTSTDTDEEEDWDWEPEDDFDLGNVWTDGPDLKKGIIYHHTQSTAIHITAFTGRIPERKGSGNTPHVFFAHGGTNGAVRISNVVPGPMPTEKEIEANMEIKGSSRRKGKEKENKKSIFPALGLAGDYDEVDDLDDGEEASDQQRDRWNDHDAFQRFLAREAARERAMRKNLEEPPSPAPPSSSQNARSNMLFAGRSPTRGLPSHSYATRAPPHTTHPYPYAQPSASSSASSLAPSSPSTLPIVLPSSDFDGDGEAWSDLDYDLEPSTDPAYDPDTTQRQPQPRGRTRAPVYEIALPLQTPFPASPRVRRRVVRVYKRMVRQTSKGLSEMSVSDDEAEEEKDELESSQESQQAREREAGEAEQEQKDDDASEESEESASEDRTEVQKRPVVALRGPNVFFAPRAAAPLPAHAYEEEYEDARRRVDDDDSDEDEEFWEDGEVEFQFVHQDDSDDEV
ncbi:hypothetical protein C8Q80DRAFT_811028 [Daedaleopsis nitida]|nr:hypothetical protein C8Q80DRAFT_811028 [Daedaleopsis nitida]